MPYSSQTQLNSDGEATLVNLSRGNYKTLGLAALGGGLEVYDFVIFVFFSLTISKLFFPPETPQWLSLLQSFGFFAAGYLVRPLGGMVMAHYADTVGRKSVFSLSILMMSLPCLAIGLMPTYGEIGYTAPLLLLVFRIVQGAAVGGEVPSAWVFVSEHTPPHRRGAALGILQAGLTVGYLIGALVASAVAKIFSPQEVLDYAWRLPFILGGLFGVVGIWLRRSLDETPIFMALEGRTRSRQVMPLRTILSQYRGAILPAVITTAVLTTAVIVVVVITPVLMQQAFKIGAGDAFALTGLAILFLNIGCVLAGWMVDRIGSWRTFLIFSFLLPVGAAVLYIALIYDYGLVPLAIAYSIAGLCCGVVGAAPSIMVELFPADIRVSGISLTYNVTYAIWASAMPLMLIALTPWSEWSCVALALIVGIAGVATALFYMRR